MFKPTGACDRNTGTDANDHGSSDADESNGVRTLGFEASLYPSESEPPTRTHRSRQRTERFRRQTTRNGMYGDRMSDDTTPIRSVRRPTPIRPKLRRPQTV
ncbi:hypothetical protein BRC68_12140 [Halobacteriales archaeon QH_6_64_20]|nr:MAG: hypothetical protein BRC68_12140 [Halobacteriales archaeon QH_6_64_20]